MSKYAPLAEYLRGLDGDEVRLTFEEIERIIGSPLPTAAHNNRYWWVNTKSEWVEQCAHGWKGAGWKVAPGGVVLGQAVTFYREES